MYIGSNAQKLLQLRKVTERARPQIGPKVDERDSLLEQIRAKVKPNLIFLLSLSFSFIYSFCGFETPSIAIFRSKNENDIATKHFSGSISPST